MRGRTPKGIGRAGTRQSAPFRALPRPLEYLRMADESNVLPASRIARWIAIGAAILFALALYFRDGRDLPPLAAPPAAAPTAEPPR